MQPTPCQVRRTRTSCPYLCPMAPRHDRHLARTPRWREPRRTRLMSGQWAGSKRRGTLPKNWTTIRRSVQERARGLCQATVHVPECDGRGAECDHIDDPLDHSMANLQWLSAACHRAKTRKESNKAKAKLSRKRPKLKHPGDQGGSPRPRSL